MSFATQNTELPPEFSDEMQFFDETQSIRHEMGDMSSEEFDFGLSEAEVGDLDDSFEIFDDESSNSASPVFPAQENPRSQVPPPQLRDDSTTPQEIRNKKVNKRHYFDTSLRNSSNILNTTQCVCNPSCSCQTNPDHSKPIYWSVQRKRPSMPAVQLDHGTCVGFEATIVPANCRILIVPKKSESISTVAAPEWTSPNYGCQSMPEAQPTGPQFSPFYERQVAMFSPEDHLFSSKKSPKLATNDTSLPMKKRRRIGHRERNPQVIDSKYVQFHDCKTKNSVTKSRHKDLQSNIVASNPNKYYRPLQIVCDSTGRTYLQTPCGCGRDRTFSLRRSIRNHVAITYFKADECTCGYERTYPLMMCFCGALFRAEKSMYSCPCFGELGPALRLFPNYADFAARTCSCPIQPRRCRCMSSGSV